MVVVEAVVAEVAVTAAADEGVTVVEEAGGLAEIAMEEVVEEAEGIAAVTPLWPSQARLCQDPFQFQKMGQRPDL